MGGLDIPYFFLSVIRHKYMILLQMITKITLRFMYKKCCPTPNEFFQWIALTCMRKKVLTLLIHMFKNRVISLYFFHSTMYINAYSFTDKKYFQLNPYRYCIYKEIRQKYDINNRYITTNQRSFKTINLVWL